MADGTIDWEAAGKLLDQGGQIAGSIPVGGGMGAVVAIPVPGTKGLAISLKPNGYVPRSGSTSTLFIQDVTGKRHLRLDYGYNKVTGRVDFHWNQTGTFSDFGIKDHTPVGRAGAALYRGARLFRYGGRALLIVGAAMDAYDVVTSNQPFRQLAIVGGGWAGAWAGCEAGGAIGAGLGTLAEPGGGTAVGGLSGCFIGGAAGYWAGKTLVTVAVDSAQAHIFHNVQEGRAPGGSAGPAAPNPAPGPTPEPISRSVVRPGL